jgi:hypothetical protein
MSNVLITVAEKKRPELAKTVGEEPAVDAKGKKKTATKTAAKKSGSSKPAAKPAAAKKKTAAKKSAK